jgi:AraC family transcriptional regulator, positive regulator of tynA and feaB
LHARGLLDALALGSRRPSVSRPYLDRLLARIGTTASQELWARRLSRAAEDLSTAAHRQRTILEVALANGFSDPAHFSRAFRKRFGQSPRSFRQQLRV